MDAGLLHMPSWESSSTVYLCGALCGVQGHCQEVQTLCLHQLWKGKSPLSPRNSLSRGIHKFGIDFNPDGQPFCIAHLIQVCFLSPKPEISGLFYAMAYIWCLLWLNLLHGCLMLNIGEMTYCKICLMLQGITEEAYIVLPETSNHSSGRFIQGYLL